jgi:chemotaxis protein CheZ
MSSAADHILQKLRDRAKEGLTREEIGTIVADALKGVSGDVSPTDLKLYAELEELARYIENAKNEIASIKSNSISNEHIPVATDELDAVVGATEDATNKIMNACDQITEIAGTVSPEASEKLMSVVMGIYEACNFQDITGQRITKVVKTLKHIETQVMGLVAAFGGTAGSAGAASSSAADPNDEKNLLNGPQLPGNAINQDEIDKLLASFDAPPQGN